jgi:hypothetical protein
MCFSLHDSNQQCTTACCKLLQQAKIDAIVLPSIITGGEAWVCGSDPETKQMSSDVVVTSADKSKASRVKNQIVLINFFDTEVWCIMKCFLKPST